MAWENETNWPWAGVGIDWSPIMTRGYEYVVYAFGPAPSGTLYRYSLTTQLWTNLGATPAQFYGAASLSPDGTRLAFHATNGNRLYIYTIATNLYVTSAAAPVFLVTLDVASIQQTVWTDDDTVWCHVVGGVTNRNKCYRYVVSTDTWTQFANVYNTGPQNSSWCMSVNSAGTRLFVGGVYAAADPTRGFRYIIATDAYANFRLTGHGVGGYRWFPSSDRNARLWFVDNVAPVPYEHFYWDCDLEISTYVYIFPGDPNRTWGPGGMPGATFEESIIIAWTRWPAAPWNRSYPGPPFPPISVTDPATEIGATTTTGNGNITATGGEDCDKRGIVYGTTSQSAPGNVAPDASGYDSYEEETGTFGTGAFTRSLVGLSPGQTYYVRAYAHNSAGYSYGAEESFTTLAAPTVTTNPASNIESTTVTLNGTLDDDGGEACDCGFEYGETTDYGTTTDTEGKTTGETFSQAVRGLKGGTVYHFRAIATNSAGTSYGADRTFHTEALSAAAHQALGKGYPLGRAEL